MNVDVISSLLIYSVLRQTEINWVFIYLLSPYFTIVYVKIYNLSYEASKVLKKRPVIDKKCLKNDCQCDLLFSKS